MSKLTANNKKVIFFSPYDETEYVFLYKEHGEIPYYFTKLFNYHGIIDNYYDMSVPFQKMFRTVELQSYSHYPRFIRFRKIFKIFRLARKIDVLYLLSIYPETLYKMLAYKLGGGKGKIYVKLDLGDYMQDGRDMLVWKNMPLYLKIAHYIFKRLPTVYTVETKVAYERLKKTYYGDLISKDKLFLMSNGFDHEILNEYNIIKKNVSEKERIIITVSRFGVFQKNADLLLNILSKVELKDWKVYLIGPQTEDFKGKITDFYLQHPNKQSSVFFTGPLDKKELYEYYNRSRVFLFTSRGESFAFALLEAAYMGNYIISTNVGVMREIMDIASGFSVDPKDNDICQKMVDELERFINLPDEELNKSISGGDLDKLTWEYILMNNKGIQKLLE